jgi:cell pole-organizing protein PopZ
MAAEADEEEDVLDLKKPAAKAAEVDFTEKAAEPEEDLAGWGVDVEEEPLPTPRSVASVPEAAAVTRQVGDVLLGAESGAAVASAFSSLAHTILQQNARTLDDLVEEMLRPMLKGWLDDNLPGIVERLVRAEIERVSRGPRR